MNSGIAKPTVIFIAVVIVCSLLASPGLTQRPFSATYDSSRQVTLHGAVTRIDWVNPNAFVFIDVRDQSGTVANWAVDIGSALELERSGWKPAALHIGDAVTVEGVPARTDVRQVSAKSFLLTQGAKRLFALPARRPARATAPAPRWPDGQIRLGPAPGKTGYWSAPDKKALVEDSAGRVAMTDDGLLLNLGDADKVAPFLPWSKALYESRQRTFLKDDPLSRCVPPGGPRQYQAQNGFEFVEQKELGRILVLLGGGDRNWRVIYMDGRPLGTAAEAVPSYYGVSVGHWEKDALVVDSVGYNEKFWLTSGGLPHTEALHLTERFTRTDLNTLRYEVTIDDPRTYKRAWSASWTAQWIPDQDIPEYFCEDGADSALVQ